ncbi:MULTISPECIES: ABC transporter ATP-binding protein [Bacillus]|uniref:ABC transporter ATP-binding protein n=1 Tax=Bacillus TaxID=1386 RepID=UPI000379D4CE|nr:MULTISPECIES: ABC transporter ATP-binding protein [Bacillus]MEB3055777.1 ABC transporter ATP-binding protein [Bacillus pseudomycoides]PEB41128.1 ABC transporter ATP-binding protein [Bacillus pseudomycoides]PGD93907.1 ABC transporter ATP-binding protein [Bacillus pseudomycoides]PGE01123.1 ABC transporter ATP-binding protein [Bacillus pseudomycoides]PGE96771.1 ABC transporter ATP-binding protein [Bacillus pseudomycoides]
MIQAKQLVKRYELKEKVGFFRKKRRVVEAVNGLDLTIQKGEIVGLLGVNGAGKTTTIKMLATLLEPTSGAIEIDGIDSTMQDLLVKKKINMIAGGERMLYWRLTGKENLQYFGSLYGLKGAELEERIQFLLGQVELKEAANTPVERYSKGMKQRLQIARGLINDPDYLFLDEPTLGLDAPVAKKLREMVYRLAKEQNKGILLTSHYLEEVEELCDHLYIIEKGRLLYEGTPDKIIQSIVREYRLEIVIPEMKNETIERLEYSLGLKEIQYEKEHTGEHIRYELKASFDMTTTVLSLLTKYQIRILQLETHKARLEDAILQIANEVSA